jgi:hypothetical protein
MFWRHSNKYFLETLSSQISSLSSYTKSINIEVDLQNHYTVSFLSQAIQDELIKYGKPLNWIVVDTDKERQIVHVKAIYPPSLG